MEIKINDLRKCWLYVTRLFGCLKISFCLLSKRRVHLKNKSNFSTNVQSHLFGAVIVITAPLAQLIEHWSYEPRVVGLSPTRSTNLNIFFLFRLVFLYKYIQEVSQLLEHSAYQVP